MFFRKRKTNIPQPAISCIFLTLLRNLQIVMGISLFFVMHSRAFTTRNYFEKLRSDFTVGKIGSFCTGHTLSFIATNCEDMESDKRKDFTSKNRMKMSRNADQWKIRKELSINLLVHRRTVEYLFCVSENPSNFLPISVRLK